MTNWLGNTLHTFRRRPWRTQRQAIALLTLSFFVAIIIGALYLTQASAVSTTGRQLEELIAQRNQLEQNNEQLRAEIAGFQSVPRLEQRARELGFVQAGRENIEYLVIVGYDPNREPVPTPSIEEAAQIDPVPVYDETFTGWLQQQWDSFTRQIEETTGE
jgi:cell division protein FtsB